VQPCAIDKSIDTRFRETLPPLARFSHQDRLSTMPQHLDRPVTIRQARCDEIIDLRHRVLRNGLPRETACFSGDDDAQARHFIAMDDAGTIVGCASVIPNPWQGAPAWQVRGMAVDEGFRKRGIGEALLRAIEQSVAATSNAPCKLWCNARTPAVDFYRRHGWEIASDEFVIETAGPHFKMTRLLPV
jgi:predicted GNAT family N-acyltransferase